MPIAVLRSHPADTGPIAPTGRSRLVPASIAWHAAMLAGGLASPGQWPVCLGAIAANHALLVAGSVTPRGRLLGPNITSLPSTAPNQHRISLSFDDGPDPDVTPKILDLLDKAGARASFFCIGTHLLRYPALAREIIARGHSIENHTQHHRHSFAFRASKGLRQEIAEAQRTIESITGTSARFFRAPAGMRNPMLHNVLLELNLSLCSWTRRGFDTANGDADRVLAKLTRDLKKGDILLLHDGNGAKSAGGNAVALTVLPKLLDKMTQLKLHSVPLPEAF